MLLHRHGGGGNSDYRLAMGLPVSSTHIALGGVFGVGFLREFIKTNYSKMVDMKEHHSGVDKSGSRSLPSIVSPKPVSKKKTSDAENNSKHTADAICQSLNGQMRKVYRHELVKRSAVFKIAAAWIITVPASRL